MKKNKISVEGGFRTKAEQQEGSKNKTCFDSNPESWEKKMENFPKYVRKQNLTRFITLYEIFKKIIDVKGSIIECGVHQGFGLLTWAKLSSIIEPTNLTRRIYGFDTFEGFPELTKEDKSKLSNNINVGDLSADTYDEIESLIKIYDSTRFLGHIQKVSLVKGDAKITIPEFIEDNPHLVVSLLFLDFDLFNPTMTALKYLVPKMPRGAIIAFDELDNPLWPGESQAMLKYFNDNKLALKRLPYDPYIAYAVID